MVGPAHAVSGPPGGPLTVEEVRELWAFVHGDIMEPQIRGHLRRTYGLCPRHTWGYAIVEVELWHGNRPFDVAVLYEDLASWTASVLRRRRPWSSLARRLRPGASCMTCAAVRVARRAERPRRGYAGADLEELATTANRLEHVGRWLRSTRDRWETRVCPLCGPGSGWPCRSHIASGEARELDPTSLSGYLEDLHRRLAGFVASMTWEGPQATAEQRSSWIEAVGWFGGWQPALSILGREP
jgi:hypothetical protein